MCITRRLRRGACLLALLLAATGCGQVTAGPSVAAGDDPGVSASTISLGVLSDLSGPYAPLGKAVVQGNQLYVDKANAAGGVCGRRLDLLVRDHGYDPQRAQQAYFALEPNVLGFLQLLGADITESIVPDMIQAQVLVAPASWSPNLLGDPYMMVVGTTYDLDVLNGLAYLTQQGRLHGGQVLGSVYLTNDYGKTALQGSQYGAGQLGMSLTALPAGPADTDFTVQVAQLKANNAAAVVLNLSPKQVAAVLGAAAKTGFTAPFLISLPGFDPSVLTGDLAAVYRQQAFVLSPIAPFRADVPGAKDAAAAYAEKFPGQKGSLATNYGYAVASAYVDVLRRACAEGGLTRTGVQKAFHEMDGVDTHGLTAPLRFSAANHPATRRTFVLRPNADLEGGLEIVSGPTESSLVNSYFG